MTRQWGVCATCHGRSLRRFVCEGSHGSNQNKDDGALDLLKRHSGIILGPGRFAGLLRGGSVRWLGNLFSPPLFQTRPSLTSRSGNA